MVKEKIAQRTVMTWRFFFAKSLTCLPFASVCVCWFNLDFLFIYSKENCIIWHLLASISAFIKCTSSTGIPAFSNKYTHRLTEIALNS